MEVIRKLKSNCNTAYAQLIARIIVCFTSSISTNSTISTFLDSMGNHTRLSTTNIPLVWVPWSSTDACKIYFHWSLLCSLVTKIYIKSEDWNNLNQPFVLLISSNICHRLLLPYRLDHSGSCIDPQRPFQMLKVLQLRSSILFEVYRSFQEYSSASSKK